MKKTLLALAVTAFTANAFAALNLDTAAGTQRFASEINIAATGTPVATATPLVATSALGVTLTKVFVRYDLSGGAKFNVAPALTTNAATPTIATVSGGLNNTFVIFSVEAAAQATADTLTLANVVPNVVNKDAVTITRGVYETVTNASNQTLPLNTKAGTLMSFTTGISINATQATTIKQIAVGTTGTNFYTFNGATGTNGVTDLIDFTVSADGSLFDVTGGTLSVSDVVTSYNWKLEGDFSAAATTTPITGFTLAADKQSATTTAVNLANGVQTFTVSKTAVIPETGVKATFINSTPAAGYTLAGATFNPAATLTREGQSAEADLALTPNGSYKNYVRISNKSSVGGKFFIQVTNDSGQSQTVALNEVAGQTSDSITAGASTTQMDINDIFNAAAAKGLTLTGGNKLRLKATGQVSNGSVSMQTYTTSKDGNSFATF